MWCDTVNPEIQSKHCVHCTFPSQEAVNLIKRPGPYKAVDAFGSAVELGTFFVRGICIDQSGYNEDNIVECS